MTELCLKARPSAAQLADRLRPVDGLLADGLELYLDTRDIADQPTMDGVVERIQALDLPEEFTLLIEGPVGSLDGSFFDVTRNSAADDEVIARLAGLARRLNAQAVNIHVITPSDDLSRLTLAAHDELLAACVPFLRRFVERMQEAGAVPTVENMPPVLRMRQGGFYFTPIGMASRDLLWLAEQIPGLRILPDTSHAGLYLNARAAAERRRLAEAEAVEQPWLAPLLQFIRYLPEEADDLLGYFQTFGELVENAQVSNAAGILGEGLPYAEGDFDLDPTIRWLDTGARCIVTETLEPDNDDACYMRDALRRMRVALRGAHR